MEVDLQRAMAATIELNKDHAIADPDRLREVYSSRFYTQPVREKLKEFCQLAASLLKTPDAYVTLITDTEAIVVAAVTPPPADLVGGDGYADVGSSYCAYVVGEAGPFVVCNSTEEAHLPLQNHPATHAGFRSYLGVPLINSKGFALGAFCVADMVPRTWKETDVIMLTQLASAIVSFHEADARVAAA